MAKKIILAIIAIIIIAFFAFNFFLNDTVNVYIDGENVSVTTNTLPGVNSSGLNREICDYAIYVMNDTSSNITALKEGIENICRDYGMENPKVTIDSSIGKNQIPVIVHVDGTSMLPTLQDGQAVLINKTHDIQPGDIVVADSDEYGAVIKRVGEIDGSQVYLESDNKNVAYEYINGELYEIKGITTWVDISEINGVAIAY
ncbi:S24/S26 family peptidase [uncultured Methanobrevibacter sp.]|uniref:S24/S26 family peptidase n=1 Tax=uncultured Methanobrevibacter sp. TaxID=253161 RepID=UPI00262400A1|nr:S24/S26 family peptidase [uncultured Methanobrevibacter sp.]